MKKIPFMPTDPSYAFAYVPFQRFENLYHAEEALCRGTIFRDLDIPFEAYACIPMMNPFVRK